MSLLPIALGTVSGHLVGGVWYSKYLFCEPWLQYAGKTSEDVKKLGAKPHIVCLASDLGLACLLDHALPKVHVGNTWAAAAMVTGGTTLLYAALGAPHNAYDNKHCGCIAIDLGYTAVRVGVVSLVMLYMHGRF